MIAHHFSVDVEEYFHPTAMTRYFPMASWDALERRSPAVIDRLLDVLDSYGVQGTFFVVGWLAEREPAMVRSIAGRGHEVASHGYEHALVAELGAAGFRASVRRSKSVLEDVTTKQVCGYRAPSFSIVPGLEWAFDVLIEEGYRYDASLFPVTQHPTYGYPGVGPDPYIIRREAGRLMEFPATTARIVGSTVPASGGAYFRLLPEWLVHSGLSQAAARGAPGMFYIHPWELDTWAPDVPAPWAQRVRTFAGRARCWSRLERMFAAFRFQPVARFVESMSQPA
jgi:polysaccharide deacetylase family protein (PEP-CTERM system associated)